MSPGVPEEGSYEQALAEMGSLISGKKRPDGRNWSHAFESMAVHLQVCEGVQSGR